MYLQTQLCDLAEKDPAAVSCFLIGWSPTDTNDRDFAIAFAKSRAQSERGALNSLKSQPNPQPFLYEFTRFQAPFNREPIGMPVALGPIRGGGEIFR